MTNVKIVLLTSRACPPVSLFRNESSQANLKLRHKLPASLHFNNPRLIVHEIVVILFLSSGLHVKKNALCHHLQNLVGK